ncbi:MAG: aromatic-ring-hydroxylating dioxygenase subunit beta [Pseudomonadota bacterium]
MSTDQAPSTLSALRSEVRDLNDDYACALDDVDLDRWAGFFTEDCHYRVVSQENFKQDLPLSTLECSGIGMVRDRIAAIRQTAVFEPRTVRHIVSSVRVAEEGGEISAQSSFVLFESLSDREPHLLMVGRYADKLVRREGRLLFRERLCVYDNYRVRTSLIYPV